MSFFCLKKVAASPLDTAVAARQYLPMSKSGNLSNQTIRKDKQLSPTEIDKFIKLHIPHRLCLLLAFRQRQTWFYEEMKAGRLSCDLLRCAKDSSLISVRLFARFLGIRLKSGALLGATDSAFFENSRADDVFVDRLGGRFAVLGKAGDLSDQGDDLLKGLLQRADKELAHLTSNFEDHDTHNTARVICDGIALIEGLLRRCLFDHSNRPFPTLHSEQQIHESKWNFFWSDSG